jgi:tetratricopeptide (TPR) repeat protein
MDLQRRLYRIFAVAQLFPILLSGPAAGAQSSSARPPALIRDTGVADAGDSADKPAVKTPDSSLSERNIKVGDFYYKRKNYAAAIARYLEAVEYQPDSARAYDGLARAYEKNEEPAKAIAAYKQFLEKNPGSPKSPEFREKLAKLEKTSH